MFPPTLPKSPPLRVESLEDRWVPSTLTVDGDGGKQFTSIGAAVAAAGANDTVRVYDAAADYTEQLTIPAGKTGLKIVGAEAGVVIKSPSDVARAMVGGADLGGAVIDVRAAKVEIRNLTIDGSTNTDGELYSGIRVVAGGSATIRDNTITGLNTAGDAQFGIGIQVGSRRGAGTAGTAKVENNVITDYLSVGVLVDGARASADVRENLIVGRGAANGFAQYGVQVGYGAAGEVERNVIANNSAQGSAGVLLYEVKGKKNEVAKNVLVNNDIGVWLYDADGTRHGRAEVLDNTVAGSGFAGILVDLSDDVSVKNNLVFGGAGDGIGVYDSTDVEVKNNAAFCNGGDGVYVFGGSCNEVKNNHAFGNGGRGVAGEDTNTTFRNNRTWGNGSKAGRA